MSLSLPTNNSHHWVYKYYKYEIDPKTRKLSLISPFRRTVTPFKSGLVHSTRTSVRLTSTEQRTSVVNDGLHVFLTKEDAITNAKSTYEKTVVVRFIGEGKNLVALGFFGAFPNAVYTTLKVDSILGFYEGKKKQRAPKWTL